MLKQIVNGIGLVIGIVIGIWLISHIGLFGIGGTIKSVITNIGEMFNNFGETLIRIGTK